MTRIPNRLGAPRSSSAGRALQWCQLRSSLTRLRPIEARGVEPKGSLLVLRQLPERKDRWAARNDKAYCIVTGSRWIVASSVS